MEICRVRFTKLMKDIFLSKQFKYLALSVFVVWIVFFMARKIRQNKGRFCPVDKSNLKANRDYKATALKLKNSLSGLNITGRTEILKDLSLNYNDDEFKEVYNNFNKLLTPSNETMRNWVNDEFLPLSSWDEEVIKRIDLLNCA